MFPPRKIRRSLTAIKEVNPITAAELSSGCITSKLGVKRDKDKPGGAHMCSGRFSLNTHTHTQRKRILKRNLRPRQALYASGILKGQVLSSQRAFITPLFNLSQSNYQRVSLTGGWGVVYRRRLKGPAREAKKHRQ